MGATLLAVFFRPIAAQAQGNQGHHQSGIFGQINGGAIIATPDGEGSGAIPNHVRVYTKERELVTEVETVTTDEALWYFEAYVKPGTYTVIAYSGVPPEDGGIMFTYPVEVTIGRKEFVEVAFTFVPTMPRIPLLPGIH